MKGKNRDGRRAWPQLGLALGLASVALCLSAAAGSEISRDYWQARSDRSPVYWGGEHSPQIYRDCCGFGWTRLNPREASIRQLNPHLRAVSDGRLLEDVASPPPPAEAVEILPYSSGPVITVMPRRFFWHGAGHAHRFMRGRR